MAPGLWQGVACSPGQSQLPGDAGANPEALCKLPGVCIDGRCQNSELDMAWRPDFDKTGAPPVPLSRFSRRPRLPLGISSRHTAAA